MPTLNSQQLAFGNGGRIRDVGSAAGTLRRMPGQARRGEEERQAAINRANRNPVSAPNEIKIVVDRSGTITPIIDANFYRETMAAVSIHLARGHFAQAIKTIEAAEANYALVKTQSNADASGLTEKLGWHVSAIFNQRTSTALEQCCNGTLGAVLEVFPGGLLNRPGVGPGMIEQIARSLVRLGLLTAEEAAERVNQWADAMLTSNPAGGAQAARVKAVIGRLST